MKITTCPITKKPMDCKSCEVIGDKPCPYWEFDKCIEKTIELIRELVEREKNER